MSHNQIQHLNSRQASNNLSNQDRVTIEISSPCRGGCGILNSSSVAHFNPTLATESQSSTIGSYAMRAASPSKIVPVKSMASFPAVSQPSSADMSAITSPTRALLIDPSLSVAVSSTINVGVALDGRLGSKFLA